MTSPTESPPHAGRPSSSAKTRRTIGVSTVFYLAGAIAFVALAGAALYVAVVVHEARGRMAELHEQAEGLMASVETASDPAAIAAALYYIHQQTAASLQAAGIQDRMAKPAPAPVVRDGYPHGRMPAAMGEGVTWAELAGAGAMDREAFSRFVADVRADAERAEQARGTGRIIFAHGAGRIYGLAEPELQWDDDVRCRLTPHPDVLHAIILLPEEVDVLYSGVPDYAATGEESPYLLADCRLHGYREGDAFVSIVR